MPPALGHLLLASQCHASSHRCVEDLGVCAQGWGKLPGFPFKGRVSGWKSEPPDWLGIFQGCDRLLSTAQQVRSGKTPKNFSLFIDGDSGRASPGLT